MATRELALYLHPPLGQLQLFFEQDNLVSVFLPFIDVLQDASIELPLLWQDKMDAYFSGRLRDFDVPISPSGTLHDAKVWQAMLDIPYGQTRSYGEIARDIGSSAQAVGNACGRNPLPIIIPCHRIVGSHGIGGFSKSTSNTTVSIKQWLLQHERAHLL